MRRQGVTLAAHLGTPGVADMAKLMTISARIGIADSARYLKKNSRALIPGGPTRCSRMAPVRRPERTSKPCTFTFAQATRPSSGRNGAAFLTSSDAGRCASGIQHGLYAATRRPPT
jgi:hypothetical protein